MNALLGAAAVLLVFAGALKVARPDNTAKALLVPPLTVRAAAAGEVVIGASALAVGGSVPAALVGASYVGFAVFVAVALRAKRPLATCGCFGEPDTPPTLVHVLLDVGAAAVALTTVATGSNRPLASLGPGGWIGAVTVAYLAFVAMTALPRAMEAKRA